MGNIIRWKLLNCFMKDNYFKSKHYIFCPVVYPLMIRLLSYRRHKIPYFKGHLGLQNWCITDICSWQFYFNCKAEPSVTPLMQISVLHVLLVFVKGSWKCCKVYCHKEILLAYPPVLRFIISNPSKPRYVVVQKLVFQLSTSSK